MQFERLDAETTVILPKHFQGYFTSKYKTDKIEQVYGHEQQIWIGILNRSLTTKLSLKKTSYLVFLF